MLIISKRQWRAIQKNMKKAFMRELSMDLRQQWPDNDELTDMAWMREKVDDAAFFGLTGRHSVRRYCELCLSEGPIFPYGRQFAWVRKILQDKRKKEEEKLDQIEWTLAAGDDKAS
ncbi:MAG: hypothetical protein JRI36_13485 [Deltaproteobacteria bacterium]|nr:hypothetical protein [Deltaproteobacteria bacterium]